MDLWSQRGGRVTSHQPGRTLTDVSRVGKVELRQKTTFPYGFLQQPPRKRVWSQAIVPIGPQLPPLVAIHKCLGPVPGLETTMKSRMDPECGHSPANYTFWATGCSSYLGGAGSPSMPEVRPYDGRSWAVVAPLPSKTPSPAPKVGRPPIQVMGCSYLPNKPLMGGSP